MSYYCLNCYKQYDERYVMSQPTRGWSYYGCITPGCNSKIVKLDDLIADSILLLNKNGYTTGYCCSGHAIRGTSKFQVLFDFGTQLNNNVRKLLKLYKLPKEFDVFDWDIQEECQQPIKGDYRRIQIYKQIPTLKCNEEKPATEKYIKHLNSIFYEWCRGMPHVSQIE